MACTNFSTTVRRTADKDGQEATGGSGHHEETFEEFTARYGQLVACLVLISLSTEYPDIVARGACDKVNWLTGNVSRYEKEFDGVQDVFELQVWRLRFAPQCQTLEL